MDNKRLIQLDVLRAIAVILVFGRHWQTDMTGTWAPVTVFIDAWYKCGWAGVDLFFVLSGFLVSGLLFREYIHYGDVNIKLFLIRRGLKIYPAFYIFLAITILYNQVFGVSFNLHGFLCEVFFIQNYGPSMWSHTWSLAVEEHFYLLLSLGVFLIVRKQPNVKNPFNKLVIVFPTVAVCCLLFRTFWFFNYPYFWKSHITLTHLRIDALMFGVWLSYLYNFNNKSLKQWVKKHRSAVFITSIAAISLPVFFDDSLFVMYTIGRTLLYMGFGGILLIAIFPSNQKKQLSLLARILSAVGLYSYSIYLWHLTPFWLLAIIRATTGIELSVWLRYMVYLTGAVFIGIIASKVVEWPVLRLRDRFLPSRSSGLVRVE